MRKLIFRLLGLTLMTISQYGLWAQCTITLQPGSEGKDAALFHMDCASSSFSSGYCDTFNSGNSTRIHNVVWTWGGEFGTQSNLLEFDLTSVIPRGCTVSNAILHLYSEGDPGQYHCGTNSTIHGCRSNDFTLYRVTQPWDEMTVTWANQPSYANNIAGRDFVSAPNQDDPYVAYSIDIKQMVNYWANNPSQNHGVLIKMNDETQIYRSAKFASSDYSDANLRPKLVLAFAGCNSACQNTKIYPNPFTINTTIEVDGYAENDPVLFELYNLLGEKVRTMQSRQSTFQVEKGQLSTGIYIYRVQANNELLGTGKLIIE